MLVAQVSDDQLKLGGLFKGLKVDVNDYEKIINQFTQLDLNSPFYENMDGSKDWNAISEAIAGCDARAISYFQTLDNGSGTINNQSASINGLKAHLEKTGQMYDFAVVKATLFNTALNAGILLAFSVVLQTVVKGIDSYIHANENAIKLTDELKDKHSSAAEKLESHRKTANQLAASYEQLSKGVNKRTNANLSLSDEDYQSFLNVTNQLAEAFPSLQTGLDANGNAILSLGENGKTASEELNQLLQKEEDLNNYKTSQDIGGLFGGVKVKVDEAREAMEHYSASSSDMEKGLQTLKALSSEGIDLSGDSKLSIDTSDQSGIETYNTMVKALQEFQAALDPERRVDLNGAFDPSNVMVSRGESAYDIYLNTVLLTEEEKSLLQTEIKAQAAEILPIVQDELGNAFSEQSSTLQEAQLFWKDFLPSLTATMKVSGNFKELADAAFGEDLQSLAIDLVSGLDYSVAEQMDEDKPYEWVRENIILPLTQLNEEGRRSVAEAYTSLLELNPNDLSDQNQSAIDGWIRQIAESLGETEQDIRFRLGFQVDDDLQRKYDDAVSIAVQRFGDSKDDVEGIFTELGIDTSSEIDQWNEIAEAADSLAEAKKQYAESLTDTPDSSIFNAEIFSGSIDALSSLQSAYSDFCKDVQEGVPFTFDISEIQNLREAFGEVCGSFDEFERLATSASTTEEELRNAFSRLAAEFITQSNVLDGLSSATREQIVSQLELKGVTNAGSILTEETARVIEEAAGQNLSLADAADEAYLSLFSEGEAGAIARKSIYALATAEIAYNSLGLNTEDKIEQLETLAAAYGDTASAALAASAASYAESMSAFHGGSYEEALEYKYNELVEKMNAFSGVTFDLGSPAPSSAASSGSSQAAEQETDLLSELNSELDEYQAKLKAVKDARETYNRYGKISIDQAQEIVNTDFRLLAAYGSEETALESLGRVKLNEMQIQLARNAIDTINSIRTEADAVQYLAGANVNLANAAGAATEVMMQQAVQAAAARGAMQGAAAETIVQGYQNAMQMLDNVDFSFDGFEIEKTPLDRFRDWFSSLFDWIEVRIERLTDKIERSVTKAKSYLESGKYDTSAYFYKQALSYSYSQIRAQQDAFKKYKQQAEVTLNRAVSEGVVSQEEADSIAKQLKDGTLNISEYSEEMQEVISSCQQWYDKTKNASKALLELHDSIRQYVKDLKDLRDTQRETRLNYLDEKSSIAAGSYTSSSDESYALEYSQLTNKRSLLSYKNRAYDKEVEKVGKDNQKIRSTAKNSVGNELRSGSAKGTSESAKAYKNALKNAKKSIDATRPVKDSDLKVIKAHSLVTYERLYAYNLSLENAEAARWEQALNYSETQNERYQLLKERYDVQKDASDNQISLAKSKASNASSAQEANRYLDEAASGYDTNLSIDKTAVSRLKGAEKRARRNILGLSGKTSVFRKQSSAVREKVNKCIKDAKNAAKAGKAIGAMTLSNLAKYYKEGYVTYGFYKACISYNDQLESRREAEAQLEIDRETVKAEKAAIGAQKFGNVEQEYANQQTAVSDKTSFIKAQQDTKTSRGLSLNESDYQSLMEQSQYEQAIYEKEAIELEKIIQANLASGYWTKTSQEYLDAMSALNSYKVKSQECKTAQEELNHTIAQLPYDTIERALELLDAIADNHKSILDLKSAKGEDLSEADYFRQIQDNNDQIEKLQKERLQAFTDYQKALADPEGVYGGRTSNEWKEEYLGIDTAINNALTDNETLKASLRDDVYWRDFERAQDALERVQNVIRGISDLISDDMLFDPDGNMTEYGITHAANLVKQYELARKEVQNYTEQIENLNKLQKEGYYEAEKGSEEFQKKLNELQAAMLNSASSMKGFSDSIIDMYKNMAQAELDVLFELIDARNEALQAKKAYYDYDKTIRSKTRDIQSLQAQRAALEGIDTAEAKAQRAALDAQIEEANEDLNDTLLEHQLELSQDALESLKETLQDSFDDKWDNIHADLNGISQLMASANELISDSAFTVTSTLNRLLQSYGIDPSAVDTAAVQTSGIRKDSASQDSSQSDFMEKLERAAAESHTLNYEIPKTIQMPSFDADRIPTTVNQTFDNLINIEGSADAATVEDLKNLSKDFLQRSYEYTSQKMYSGYIKAGGKRQI